MHNASMLLINAAHTVYEMRPRSLANAIVRALAGYSFDFLRCRYFTSRCKAETTNCPVVSPSSFTRTVYVPAQCVPLPAELTQPVLVPLPPVAD